MVSEFPFHKPYFPWQEQQAKSFGCFWDIFERGSREQECCYLTAHRSVDFSNPRQAQWHQTTTVYMHYPLKKKVPFRVKNPLEMHSTDALHLKTPCLFPLGINQFHREKTQLSSVIIRQNTLLINWMFFFSLWDTQPNVGSLSGPINLNWMSSSICLMLSGLHLLLNLMWRTWMTGLHSDMQPAIQKQSNASVSWRHKTQRHNKHMIEDDLIMI